MSNDLLAKSDSSERLRGLRFPSDIHNIRNQLVVEAKPCSGSGYAFPSGYIGGGGINQPTCR